MSIRARIKPDLDDERRERHEEERRRREREDESDEEKNQRSEREREERKKIRARAEYSATTQGGYVEDWIKQYTPIGEPFSDYYPILQGYRFAKAFDYTSSSGSILYQSVKYEHKNNKREKTFRLRQPACPWDKGRYDDAKWIEKWAAGKPFAVIYRWHEIAARPGELVIVCEGEGNADRMRLLGFPRHHRGSPDLDRERGRDARRSPPDHPRGQRRERTPQHGEGARGADAGGLIHQGGSVAGTEAPRGRGQLARRRSHQGGVRRSRRGH
jgi:hypothetical protein